MKPGLVEILLDHLASSTVLLNKAGLIGTAAEGFQSKSSGTGEKIEHPGSFDPRENHGKERFPDTIRGRPGHGGGNLERMATGDPGNDSHDLRSRFVISMWARSSNSRSSLLRLPRPWATILSSKGSISRAMNSFLESTTG